MILTAANTVYHVFDQKRAFGCKRGANWDVGEELLLVEEVLLREGVLFGKFSGGGGSITGSGKVTVMEKEKAWEEIVSKLNA